MNKEKFLLHKFGKHCFILSLFVGILMPTFFISADEIKGQFPNDGLLWMSSRKGYVGYEYVSSNNCNNSEVSAYTKIKNSTIGTVEMSRWKNGVGIKQYTCDGSWDSYTDIKLEYGSQPTDAGGQNYSVLADSSFCGFWNTSYPCGVRPTVKINLAKWNNTSSAGRERLIIHETGHSNGLRHHCLGDSVMNDGSSSCNQGRWSVVMNYQPTDRKGINSIY